MYRESWCPTLLVELKRLANPPHLFGLLGFAITQEEYASYTVVVFQPLPEPAIPVIGSDADTWQRYNLLALSYRQQETAKSTVVGCIISRLGPTAREVIRDPLTGRYSQDLGDIMEALDRQFLTITHQELENGKSALKEKFNQRGKMSAHVAKHLMIHKLFADSGNPINTKDKNDLLAESVSYDPEIADAIKSYYHIYSNIADQTFNRLKTTIVAASENRRTPMVENEFASAVKGIDKYAEMEARLNEVIRENARLNQLLSRTTAQSAGQHQRSPSSTLFPPRYCWSHGKGNHVGRDCFTPKEGHKNEATLENTMGGSQRGIKRS